MATLDMYKEARSEDKIERGRNCRGNRKWSTKEENIALKREVSIVERHYCRGIIVERHYCRELIVERNY